MPNTIEKPKTMAKTVDRIWEVVEGDNGGGLKAMVKANTENINLMKDDLSSAKADVAFIRGRLEGHMDTAKPSTKVITIRRIIEIMIGFGVLAAITWMFLSIWLGKISVSEAAGLIEALRGSIGQ